MLNSESPTAPAENYPAVVAVCTTKRPHSHKYRIVIEFGRLLNCIRAKVPKHFAPSWPNSATIQPKNAYTKVVALAPGCGSQSWPFSVFKSALLIAQPKEYICRMRCALRCKMLQM